MVVKSILTKEIKERNKNERINFRKNMQKN